MLQIFILLLTCQLFLVQCSSAIENDARELAKLHQQKKELVVQLLRVNDSISTAGYRQKLEILEYQFKKMENHCRQKYCDSLQHATFDRAYKQALIKYK